MKGHVKKNLTPRHLPEKLLGRFAPSSSGVASQFPRMPELFFSPRSPRPLWFPEGVWVYLSFSSSPSLEGGFAKMKFV